MSSIPDATPSAAHVAADTGAGPHEDISRTADAGSELRAIKGYSVPGEGSSTLISIVTVIALLLLWWVATHFGWIKDLFLPT
ncbi:MAG TPA: taurine ABC transporter permease, partial [Casimicrobiaceae bacterium]